MSTHATPSGLRWMDGAAWGREGARCGRGGRCTRCPFSAARPPCSLSSRLHPGFIAGEIAVDASKPQVAVQEAYTPDSRCFGCGPAADGGLSLRSFRAANGLEARTTLDARYQAFPGIVNGGIISALFDCHGNWTAAVALMDRACLPRPPLTLTAELLIHYREPTPPGVPLVLRSSVAGVREAAAPGGKAAVTVDLTLHAETPGGGPERLLATGTGIFKKLGALRAL